MVIRFGMQKEISPLTYADYWVISNDVVLEYPLQATGANTISDCDLDVIKIVPSTVCSSVGDKTTFVQDTWAPILNKIVW